MSGERATVPESIDFSGTHHRIDRAGIRPLPSAPIAIWCGGSSEQAIRRAAKVVDGFIFGSVREAVFSHAPKALELVAQAGRDPAEFGLEAVVDITAGEAAWERAAARWASVGGTHFSIRTISTAADWMKIEAPGFQSIDEHISALEKFASTCF